MKRNGEDTKVDGLVEQGILQEPGMQRTGVRKGIGLVLVGGGGRGAYHIGVWKALRDTGLENYITAVSGSSVGGLNAALFIQKDLDKAQDIWKSISMETILTPRFKSEHSRPALFERDGLGRIIDEGLDMRCFDNGEYNCWIACVRVDGGDNKEEEIQYINFEGRKVVRKYVCGRTEYFNLKHVQGDDTRKKILLATSAMPLVFPKEEIDGHHYEDGGIKDNIPLRPLYEIDKSMYEEIEIYENNLKDFKEYIELWIHEVKLPISSAKLMIHNHEQNVRKLKDQVNRIENYVEQVLYYARKDNSEKDYLIKSCDLGMIIRNVIKRNQDSLLYQKINIEIEQINYTVLSDTKWLEFIINQIVSNSIKYHCQNNCKIIFKVIKTNNIALEIIDNGIGIKKSDLSKVFNKSFTGENGRLVSSSTGMGLYIVKRLCDKLGHKIIVESQYNKYTKVTLYFNDDQYYNVVR